jgi:hypothetical protein
MKEKKIQRKKREKERDINPLNLFRSLPPPFPLPFSFLAPPWSTQPLPLSLLLP